jgi:TonB family protein
MRFHRILLALLAAGPCWAQTPLKIPSDEFLRHAQTWQLPEYPRKSASDRHAGVVTATIDVDDQGRVTGVKVVSSPDVEMTQTVKSVVSQWIFRPFTEGTSAKPVESTIYIQFRLQPMGPHVMIPGLTKEPEATVKDPLRRNGP